MPGCPIIIDAFDSCLVECGRVSQCPNLQKMSKEKTEILRLVGSLFLLFATLVALPVNYRISLIVVLFCLFSVIIAAIVVSEISYALVHLSYAIYSNRNRIHETLKKLVQVPKSKLIQ
eukprot:Awhi_evm1s15479